MVASARWVARAMSQVPVVVVAAAAAEAAAVQANARSLALKWLSILSTLLRARTHATRWPPALLRMVVLQTIDTINGCPVAQHIQTTYRCGCLLRLFTHTCTSWFSVHIPEAGRNRTRVVEGLDSPAPSGDGAVADAGGSGCDSASDSNGEPNEPSGCCADADVEDRNGLDVEICVKLGDDVTAAM